MTFLISQVPTKIGLRDSRSIGLRYQNSSTLVKCSIYSKKYHNNKGSRSRTGSRGGAESRGAAQPSADLP